MVQLGFTLSSEEVRPNQVVGLAHEAEAAGFSFAGISDHYHPWIDAQGQSAFVWSVLGGIAQVTERLEVITGVTCPIIRIHPAIIAQAAATVADMLPGRFLLGVGTGEYLNEHITGAQWPPISKRQEMLAEAIEVIRKLWEGDYTTHYGEYYTVENARIYTLPEQLPPIVVAAAGADSAELAAQIGQGLVSTSPDKEVVDAFGKAGGNTTKVYGQLTVCYAKTKEEGVQTALKAWPNSGIPGQLSQELALPKYFEEAAELVTEQHIEQSIVCGPDPEEFMTKIKEWTAAGFTHVYLHQVGEDQQGFIDFAKRELLPHVSELG
jgi:G6PDH family F420-dependent oxidoreductase